MNKVGKTASGPFLMEMIIVVFFFIMCASVCILSFVKASNLSRTAEDTNQSVLLAQSIAEEFKTETVDEDFAVYRDSEWKEVSEEAQAVYVAHVSISQEDQLRTADITVTRIWDQKLLYEINTKHYIAQTP